MYILASFSLRGGPENPNFNRQHRSFWWRWSLRPFSSIIVIAFLCWPRCSLLNINATLPTGLWWSSIEGTGKWGSTTLLGGIWNYPHLFSYNHAWRCNRYLVSKGQVFQSVSPANKNCLAQNFNSVSSERHQKVERFELCDLKMRGKVRLFRKETKTCNKAYLPAVSISLFSCLPKEQF